MTLPTGWTLGERALLSSSGRYRYYLRRHVGVSGAPVVFCMLTPSTADADLDDPTIRRCVAYAKRWKASDLAVVNLFALRSTDPAALFADDEVDPEGPDNDTIIRAVADFCYGNGGTFVCAWGSAGKTLAQKRFVAARAETVRGIVESAACTPTFLRLSDRTGQPWHPLYLPSDLRPQAWMVAAHA